MDVTLLEALIGASAVVAAAILGVVGRTWYSNKQNGSLSSLRSEVSRHRGTLEDHSVRLTRHSGELRNMHGLHDTSLAAIRESIGRKEGRDEKRHTEVMTAIGNLGNHITSIGQTVADHEARLRIIEHDREK